jgi:hypothetical protein
MHPAATQGLGDLSFAVCDSSDPRQQWCVTGTGAIKDRWGRCLTRHDCGNPSSPEKVIVDSCTMGACAGSQSWHFDEDEKQIKSILGNACLDISVFENSAQTYGCKKNDKSKGPGYCGDANQQWDLRDDGTLAVPTQPKVRFVKRPSSLGDVHGRTLQLALYVQTLTSHRAAGAMQGPRQLWVGGLQRSE